MVQLVCTSNNKELSRACFKHYLNELPEYFKKKILSYHRWEDAQASLFGTLLVKHLLLSYQKGLTINDLMLSKLGKPYINNFFDFNISHSGSYVVCVYSDEGKIGIDLEMVREIDLNYFQDSFNRNEIETLKRSNDPYDVFYNFWTMKEAALKADGRGLTIPLNEVTIETNHVLIENNKWALKKIDFQSDYVMYIASENTICNPLKFRQIEF